MEALANRNEAHELLSGVWEGASTSRSNDPTYWRDASLVFSLGDDGVRGVVDGGGVSLWRTMLIDFDVTGTFNWETKEIMFTKQHKGQFTNSVVYTGTIVLDTLTITGRYGNGVINLSKRPDVAPPAESKTDALSGIWEGQSISRTNDPTTWTETKICFEFSDARQTSGRLRGQGHSLWRGLAIEFDVEGDFDWGTKTVVLTKIHKGRYTNRVEYTGKIVPHAGEIRGTYANGTIRLTRVKDLSGRAAAPEAAYNVYHEDALAKRAAERKRRGQERAVRERKGKKRAAEAKSICALLDGEWSGESESLDGDGTQTHWRETALKFSLNPATGIGKLKGAGVSLWRDMKIDFDVHGTFNWATYRIELCKQHKGRYTNQVSYSGWLLPHGMRDVASAAAGSGDGSRADVYDEATVAKAWATALRRHKRSLRSRHSAHRRGASAAPSGEAAAAAAGRGGGSSPPVVRGEAKLAADSSSDSESDDLARAAGGDSDGGTQAQASQAAQDPAAATSPWRGVGIRIVATYPRGSLALTKVHSCSGQDSTSRAMALMLGTEHGSAAAAAAAATGAAATGGGSGGSGDGGGGGGEVSGSGGDAAVDSPLSRSRLNYRYFLSGTLTAGSLSAKQEQSLAKFRASCGITEEQHIQTLNDLGYSRAEYALLSQVPEGESEVDTCKICFVNRINTVILPCGHFSICLECSRNLISPNCPICRDKIRKIQPIYRA